MVSRNKSGSLGLGHFSRPLWVTSRLGSPAAYGRGISSEEFTITGRNYHGARGSLFDETSLILFCGKTTAPNIGHDIN